VPLTFSLKHERPAPNDHVEDTMRATRCLLLMALFLGANARAVVAGELQPASPDTRTVLVRFGGTMLPALWLNGHDDGWTVPLPYAADDACTARLHDLGPAPLPTLARRERVPPHQATLSLPRARYTGEHSYRISFHCQSSKVADLLIHLDAPPRLASR
jgi:hypothetical protein